MLGRACVPRLGSGGIDVVWHHANITALPIQTVFKAAAAFLSATNDNGNLARWCSLTLSGLILTYLVCADESDQQLCNLFGRLIYPKDWQLDC